MNICLVLLAVVALALPGQAGAVEYPAGFEERTLVSGLDIPVAFDWTPDGRLFIAEKSGRLRMARPGSGTATTILDLSARVNSAVDRGMLGLAVDSDFASNGYLYLLYTYELQPMMRDGDGEMVSQLLRVKLSGDEVVEQKVLLGTYTSGSCPQPDNTLDCIPSDSVGHSIGTVRSAPDGTLWVGSGDASDFGGVDPTALRTYDERTFAGKIMRVDREGRGLADHRFCPSQTNLNLVCTKLHSKGFRNPFRFSLLPGGGLVVADVGWGEIEELDVIRQAGRSYGWPCYEATQRTPGYDALAACEAEYDKEGTAAAHVGPKLSYHHHDPSYNTHPLGASVIAGPQYEGDDYPAGYRGSVFYGDYVTGFIRRLSLDAQGNVTGTEPFATDWYGVSLEPSPAGNLAYPDFGTFGSDGSIREIVYTPGNRAPRASIRALSPTAGPVPLTVDFDAGVSDDPDGDSVSYDWDFGDGSAHSSAVKPRHVFTTRGAKTVRLTVSDGRGRSDSETLTVYPGESGPVPKIEAPVDESLFAAGSDLDLRGSGADAEDGPLPASALKWKVLLHHAAHVHSVSQPEGVAEATVATLRDHDADSWYEVTLTATDSRGLTGAQTIEVRPDVVDLTVTSLPTGAPVSYAGSAAVFAPYTRTTAKGFATSASATASFTSAGRPFHFDRWEGGSRERVLGVTVPDEDFTLRALYVEDKAAGQSAAASGSVPGSSAGWALDGNESTAWTSPATDAQSWQIDLGRPRTVDRVELLWSQDFAPGYRLLASLDGVAFTEVATDGAAQAGSRLTRFAPQWARWVRVEATSRQPDRGIGLREVRVLGPADVPPLEPEPRPDPDPEPEPDSQPGSQPEPAPQPEPDSQPGSQPEPALQPEPDPEDTEDGPSQPENSLGLYTRAVMGVRSLIAHYGLGEPVAASSRRPARKGSRSWTHRPGRGERETAWPADSTAVTT